MVSPLVRSNIAGLADANVVSLLRPGQGPHSPVAGCIELAAEGERQPSLWYAVPPGMGPCETRDASDANVHFGSTARLDRQVLATAEGA